MRTFRPVRVATLWATLALAAPVSAQQDPVAQARAALLAGEYDEVVSALRGESSRPALELHARALVETGEYADALDLLGGDAGPAPHPELEVIRGEVLLTLGRWDDAGVAWRRAVDGGAANSSLALLRQGELVQMRGRRAEAMQLFDGFIDLYNDAARLRASDLYAVGLAVAHLGRSTPELFQDALRALDEASQADPDDPRVPVAIGRLFLDRYNSTEAYASFGRVLERNPRHPDALLGEARAQDFDGNPAAMETVRLALETNPNHAEARAFLASLHLRAEAYDQAVAEAERALDVNSRSLEALSVLGAIHQLRGDVAAWEAARDRVFALNPEYAELYVTAAQLASDHRKYAESAELASRAIQRDSLSWEAWGIRGMNRLRAGQMESGRADVERAFEGDPYNPWFKNTLDLLDTFDQYETITTPHFELILHGEESATLAPYLTALAEEAFASLRDRYGAEPPTPVRVEVFPRHNDFSVRTFGLVGLGALGVSFGSTLVMDSPSATDPGAFNWASVFWHELAHAFHLGLTDHNVPRWFSEGLAVREQRVARPHWGMDAGVEFLRAYQSDRMPPVSRLNEAFVRPQFPGQVQLGYFQASLVFDWMEEAHGFQAVRAFLRGYREGKSTEQLGQEVLGLDADELDDAFDDYVHERYASEMRATAVTGAGTEMLLGGPGGGDIGALQRAARQRPGDFTARLAFGYGLLRAERLDEAETELRAALDLFPDYPGGDGPLRALATIHAERGEPREAAELLYRLGELGEDLYQVHLDEAELRREIGDEAGERHALARAVEIYPLAMDTHRRLAELARVAGDFATEAVERRAILGLEPADRADAHYRLALALRDARRPDEARTQVLRALEIAPGFDEALELLLELRGGGR